MGGTAGSGRVLVADGAVAPGRRRGAVAAEPDSDLGGVAEPGPWPGSAGAEAGRAPGIGGAAESACRTGSVGAGVGVPWAVAEGAEASGLAEAAEPVEPERKPGRDSGTGGAAVPGRRSGWADVGTRPVSGMAGGAAGRAGTSGGVSGRMGRKRLVVSWAVSAGALVGRGGGVGRWLGRGGTTLPGALVPAAPRAVLPAVACGFVPSAPRTVVPAAACAGVASAVRPVVAAPSLRVSRPVAGGASGKRAEACGGGAGSGPASRAEGTRRFGKWGRVSGEPTGMPSGSAAGLGRRDESAGASERSSASPSNRDGRPASPSPSSAGPAVSASVIGRDGETPSELLPARDVGPPSAAPPPHGQGSPSLPRPLHGDQPSSAASRSLRGGEGVGVGRRGANALKGSEPRQGDHTPVDSAVESSVGSVSGGGAVVSCGCRSAGPWPTGGGWGGRGGMEACCASVLMHPRFLAPGPTTCTRAVVLALNRSAPDLSVPDTHTRTDGPASRCGMCSRGRSAVRARHSTGCPRRNGNQSTSPGHLPGTSPYPAVILSGRLHS